MSEPAVREGESLFVDFDMTLGFDDHGDRPLTYVRWTCRICGEHDTTGFTSIKHHARSHAEAS